MLLRYSLGEMEAAAAIDKAVREVIAQGYRTGDLCTGAADEIKVDTRAMGDAIVSAVQNA